jgi:hypothetical protein
MLQGSGRNETRKSYPQTGTTELRMTPNPTRAVEAREIDVFILFAPGLVG